MQRAIKQVRDLAIEQPSSVRVFERFNIDYCCGGRKPLEAVCAERQIALSEVLGALDEAEQISPQPIEPWTTRPLSELVEHIVQQCHAPTRSELERMVALSKKVRSRHGERHPELVEVEALVHKIAEEMGPHMYKEEQILFPYIVALEGAARHGLPAPAACFGEVEAPIAAMMAEHDVVGGALASIRRLTNDFEAPEGACPTYLALYSTLEDFESLTHRHVHLENNVLFPRTMALGEATRLEDPVVTA
jgi:regulator of cell morphogenesis and NO signaling